MRAPWLHMHAHGGIQSMLVKSTPAQEAGRGCEYFMTQH